MLDQQSQIRAGMGAALRGKEEQRGGFETVKAEEEVVLPQPFGEPVDRRRALHPAVVWHRVTTAVHVEAGDRLHVDTFGNDQRATLEPIAQHLVGAGRHRTRGLADAGEVDRDNEECAGAEAEQSA